MAGEFTIRQETTKTILTIDQDGTIMRDGKPLADLSADQLRVVVVELVEMLRRA